MKEIWVLTIKTSLPKTCASYDDLKMTVMALIPTRRQGLPFVQN